MDKVLVGLHGLPRVGKDTLADFLAGSYGFERFAYADEVYREVAEAYGVTEEQLRSHDWKTTHRDELSPHNCNNPEFLKVFWNNISMDRFTTPQILTSRRVLQLWGTEYRQNLYGRDYWLRRLEQRIAERATGSLLVITDVRYYHEAAHCYGYASKRSFQKVLLMEVTRAGSSGTGHSSDEPLTHLILNGTIANNSSIASLQRNVSQLMSHHGITPRSI